MVYQFDGRTEKEAIDKAARELGMEKDRFDVEILETHKGGLFKKGFVKIQVHTVGNERAEGVVAPQPVVAPQLSASQLGVASQLTASRTRDDERSEWRDTVGRLPTEAIEASGDFETAMVAFIETLVKKMGCDGKASLMFREVKKLGIKIDSPDSSLLIGKKGKTLDAIQTVANIYAGRLGYETTRIIVDSENYRTRREEALVKLAYTVADRVRGSRSSLLLEPMNPFERRIIHTALNDLDDLETKSEGEGLYKQVRVFYRGAR
jgi:spoIIIJ-associated protein